MSQIVKSFPNLTVGTVLYGFSHLVPFGFDLPGQARGGGSLRIRVSYQSHVFSKSCDRALLAFDFRDESGAKRVFCADRYAQSLHLPQKCYRMLSGNSLTWESWDRNRVSNMAVIDEPLVDGVHYVILYYVFPSMTAGVDVELVVKSAYEKPITFAKSLRRFRVVQIVRKCHFESIKVPR